MTKGPLSKEEFDLISQNMQGTSSIVIASDGVKDRFDEICRDIVTWRYALVARNLNHQQHTTNAQAFRALLSPLVLKYD